jgi:hypothetical protein
MTRIDNTSRKTQSLARLLAEEAFSTPAPKPVVNVPVVRIVGRRLSLATTADASPASSPAPDAGSEQPKKPRVFVIRSNAGDVPQTEAETEVASSLRPRVRRRASVAAPAPVQVIYSAPERPAPAAVSLELLAGSLASIEPTFDNIRLAMAFEVSDPAIVAEWEQLSRAADRLTELLAS